MTAAPAFVSAQVQGESSPRKYEWGFPEYPPTPAGSGNATPFGEGPLNAIETESGHELYRFPRDHRYHYGPIYRGPEYCEWYYFSASVYDKATGDPYTIFWMTLFAGWDEGLQRPVKNMFFALHNLKTGAFKPAFTLYPGEFVAEGSPSDAPKEDFWTPWGPGERRLRRLMHGPPQPRDGLRHLCYTIAPKMMISGPVVVDCREMEVEGLAWWEHQWGNLRTPDHLEGHYIWQNAYLDNGDMFRLRFWRKPDLSVAD
ncbi:hypothetical protein [Rhodosalinus sp. 5P4]|uniref:hypothetical protein n=1 Tax=Rhodosalinus sp. 5P4 TaxID=3239196 RepID=UPI003523567A